MYVSAFKYKCVSIYANATFQDRIQISNITWVNVHFIHDENNQTTVYDALYEAY